MQLHRFVCSRVFLHKPPFSEKGAPNLEKIDMMHWFLFSLYTMDYGILKALHYEEKHEDPKVVLEESMYKELPSFLAKMIHNVETSQHKYDIQTQEEIEGRVVEEIAFEKRKGRTFRYWYSPHILKVNGKYIDIQPIIGHKELQIMLEEYLQGLFLDLFPKKYNFSIQIKECKEYSYYIDIRWS